MRFRLVLSLVSCLGFGAVLAACHPGAAQTPDDSTPPPPAVGEGSDGGTSPGDGGTGSTPSTEHFSFFVTSLEAMRQLSGSANGFGGDLRLGEATGLAGADKLCRTLAELSLPGSGQKTWRAFLSASTGPEGIAVNAIDRIGEGPWYDRTGRLVSENKVGLVGGFRPASDPIIKNDLPNERGEPNHQGLANHDVLTGSTTQGTFSGTRANTCNDWTSAVGSTGKPLCGHSWPRGASTGSGAHWLSEHAVPGCAAGVNLDTTGGSSGDTVGGAGGYGAIYCFALTP